MDRLFEFPVQSIDVECLRGKQLQDITLLTVSSIWSPKAHSLTFMKEIKPEYLEKLQGIHDALILVPMQAGDLGEVERINQVVRVDSPRREYAIILQYILDVTSTQRRYKTLESGVVIGENVTVHETAYIEPFVFINHDSVIGARCILRSGARIGTRVIIGAGSVIRENAVVGGQGFGIERDAEGRTYRIPHVGGVIIGQDVEVGALTTVCAGTIDPTIIEDYVKIDDHVHIAHNCHVERGAYVIANALVGGSTRIGANSWIAPTATLKNGIRIGADVTVGLGAVVTRDVPPGLTVAGNPAEDMDTVKKMRKIQKQLLEASESKEIDNTTQKEV